MGAEVRDENCEYKGAVHMKMVELEYDFNEAIKQRAKFIGVLIKMPGFDRPEVIINSYENFNKKLAYYKKTYDEDLEHKFSKGIKIIDSCYGNSYSEISIALDQERKN
jgi:hypothetical protein